MSRSARQASGAGYVLLATLLRTLTTVSIMMKGGTMRSKGWIVLLVSLALLFFRLTPEAEERSGDPSLDAGRRGYAHLGTLAGQDVWIDRTIVSEGPTIPPGEHSSAQADEGTYLDNIVRRAFSASEPTTYITRDDNENNAHTGSPDGDMFPGNSDCIYNNAYKSNCPDLRNPLAPIEFNIVVPTLPSFSIAELSIYAYDIDEQGDSQNPGRPVERDEVYLNGHLVGTLTGANDAWTTSHWFIDPSWVQQGNNLVQVRIDLHDACWCTSVDWGQLVLDGGGGTAYIRSWGPIRDCWQPGYRERVLVEVDTSLASQEVGVEINVLNTQIGHLIGTSQTKTVYGTQDDAVLLDLDVPMNSTPGHYTLQVIVYDTQSGLQQDYDERTIRIDRACPSATITPTATRTPTATPTPTATAIPNLPPELGTITPPSGSGAAGVTTYFDTTWRDPDGWEDLKRCYFHIGASSSLAGNVTLLYDVRNNKLWMRSDDGSSWLGGYAPWSDNTIENRQAKVYCLLTRDERSGDTLSVRWAIKFKVYFRGVKKTGLKCTDLYGAKAKGAWVGTWNIY
jgi:hypothetical protein